MPTDPLPTEATPRLAPVECSVVIPYFATPDATGELVDRLLQEAASGSVDAEVIVVDDCSPVPLPARPGVRQLRHLRNQGFGSAVNTGARAASKDVLVVLNSDLRPGDNFLTSLVSEALPAFPALVSADVRTPLVGAPPGADAWDPLTVQDFPGAWGIVSTKVALLNRDPRRRPVVSSPITARARGPQEGWIGATAFCIESALFREVGGFDPDFYMYVEDIDLQWRLHQRGVPVVLGDVVADHVGGASSDRDKALRWGNEGYFVYARKRGFFVRMLVMWVAMIGANFAYDVLRRATGRRVAPMITLAKQVRLLRGGLRAGLRASSDGPPALAADPS